jgi:outer membrane protein insertion porin family
MRSIRLCQVLAVATTTALTAPLPAIAQDAAHALQAATSMTTEGTLGDRPAASVPADPAFVLAGAIAPMTEGELAERDVAQVEPEADATGAAAATGAADTAAVANMADPTAPTTEPVTAALTAIEFATFPAATVGLEGDRLAQLSEDDVSPSAEPSGEEMPGAEMPDTETPGTETPGTETPDVPTSFPAEPADTPAADAEANVLVAEVVVSGAGTTELEDAVYGAIRTRAGQTTTRSQLQEDINRVFNTGLFSNVRAVPEDTPLGVRITFEVQPNPVLSAVRIEGSRVLPEGLTDELFAEQYGETLDLNRFQEGVDALNQWYRDNGYVLAQVVGAPQVGPDGSVTLQVAEGEIEAVNIVFLNEDGDATDEEGNPIQGRTRDFIILREMELAPGDTFNREQIQADLQSIFALGIFDDVQLTLNPGQDQRKVNVVLNVTEKRTAVLGAEAGYSTASGFFGALSFQEQNLGGNNQKLGAEIQISERGVGFDIAFTDPWIAGDPYGTSYTVNLFKQRSISLIFDGGEREVELPNGDRPRIDRLGGGITFTRPFDDRWTVSLGTQYQRVSIQDSDGDVSPEDELGNDLSFSGTGEDDLWTIQLGAVYDARNDRVFPTQGSLLRIGTEQSVPVGSGSIFYNRLRANYSMYFPVDLTGFTEGPEALAFNIQGGAVLGDLPPYEAFPLGGTNSVRGYDEGDLGSARYFVLGSLEYRFPIFNISESIPIGGVLFIDAASDLGSGSEVPGDPAGIRDKPGSGFGVGVGLRARTPFGSLRLDYGISDQGDGRIHFSIGERF